MTDEKLQRLSKVMSQRGLASRREADRLIEKGWVLVNGQVVDTLGAKVDPHADIRLKVQAQGFLGRQKTFILYKPVGYVSSQPEKNYRSAVELITPANRWEKDPLPEPFPKKANTWLQGLAPAGRLDIDSEGLLILSQNGRLVKSLIGPDSRIEKEYLVRFEGQMTAAKKTLLEHGLSLDGVQLRPAQVDLMDENFVKMTLTEGRKRQVRRMLELVDLKVLTLKRVRVGPITLGHLPKGKWRHLEDAHGLI